MTGRESPYTQALALWDELGLQGWLDEDEQTIKTLGVRVAAQGEYAVRQTFDGAVWIGSKTTERPAGRISPDLPIPSN